MRTIEVKDINEITEKEDVYEAIKETYNFED